MNSTGFSGNLATIGSTVVAHDSLAVEISCCPAQTCGLVVTTCSNAAPIQSTPVGAGTLCIANFQLGRFAVFRTDAAGTATQPVNPTAIPTSLAPAAALPGDV